MVVCGSLRWFMVVCGGSWWFVVVHGDLWWFIVVCGGLWCFCGKIGDQPIAWVKSYKLLGVWLDDITKR